MTDGSSGVPLSPFMEAGDLVFISGQVPYANGTVVGSGAEEQAAIVIDIIEGILAQVGLTLANVVKVNVWLVDGSHFAAFNKVYCARLAPPYPARSTVVSGLVVPGALIEIDAVASRTVCRH